VATSNLFRKDKTGNISIFGTPVATQQALIINATTTPSIESPSSAAAGPRSTYRDIRTYIKGELRIEATANAQAGKISFGTQAHLEV
jgi:hypothetical protein